MLWVTGTNNNGELPDPLGQDILVASEIACFTKSVGVALFQVPNQPLRFSDDPLHKRRREDEIIGKY